MLRRLTPHEVHSLKIKDLGLDSDSLDLTSPEALSSALRRSASFLCPCSAATLIRSVIRPLKGLVSDLDSLRIQVEQSLESVIAIGDIIEAREVNEADSSNQILLYAAPPSFVMRSSGRALILGIAGEQRSPFPSEIESRIQHLGHSRILSPSSSSEDLRAVLRQFELLELPWGRWINSPEACTAPQALSLANSILDSVGPSGDIPHLRILDPNKSVLFYNARWVEPKAHTGRFIGRRKQAYGADLWCYVQLRDGLPERMFDFPQQGSQWRGCDEAWRLQLAIDAVRGYPQQYRVSGAGHATLIHFFSPVPAWACRRWDAIGECVPTSGSLFSYRIPTSEISEEQRFIHSTLWLQELK